MTSLVQHDTNTVQIAKKLIKVPFPQDGPILSAEFIKGFISIYILAGKLLQVT